MLTRREKKRRTREKERRIKAQRHPQYRCFCVRVYGRRTRLYVSSISTVRGKTWPSERASERARFSEIEDKNRLSLNDLAADRISETRVYDTACVTRFASAIYDAAIKYFYAIRRILRRDSMPESTNAYSSIITVIQANRCRVTNRCEFCGTSRFSAIPEEL